MVPSEPRALCLFPPFLVGGEPSNRLSPQPPSTGSGQSCPEEVLVVGGQAAQMLQLCVKQWAPAGDTRGLKQAQGCPLILRNPGQVGGLISISQIKDPKSSQSIVSKMSQFSRHPKAGGVTTSEGSRFLVHLPVDPGQLPGDYVGSGLLQA